MKQINPHQKIFLYDEFNPEDNAMLQALYSRSPESVEAHVKKVKAAGSGNFMKQFYVGYGHSSIADCGSTTIFIEKISILADKAIQDWQLYSGQETSTRYVDMSQQPIIDPLQNTESKEILKAWMDFYIDNMPKLQSYLKEKYPIQADQNVSVYEKAIAARSFDIMRGFLPAGITTQLSWHTNLRQAWDKLSIMRNHPLEEVRDIANSILTKLKEKYPHSFSHENHQTQEDYRKGYMAKYHYFNPDDKFDFKFSTTIEPDKLRAYQDIIDARPVKTNLPMHLLELGQCTFEFLLDMGSFRDIQRHRNGICRMPLLTVRHGFNNWYLDELSDEIRNHAIDLINLQNDRISKLASSPEIKQYYIAMGFNVSCRVTYGLPAAVYTIELRSGSAVHPTLRKIAHKMHNALIDKFPFLKLYCDLESSRWDINRGKQDIIKK